MKGVKQGQTVILEVEPMIPDGTEVEVLLPTEWEEQRRSLLSVGYHPEFGRETDEVRLEWNPEKF